MKTILSIMARRFDVKLIGDLAEPNYKKQTGVPAAG